MPSVLIEIRKKYSPEQEIALMNAVHNALQEAFKILPTDKNVRLIIHEPHSFAVLQRVNNQSYILISALIVLQDVPWQPNEIYIKQLSAILLN